VVELARARAISVTTVAWIKEVMRETTILRTMPCDAIRRITVVNTVEPSASYTRER